MGQNKNLKNKNLNTTNKKVNEVKTDEDNANKKIIIISLIFALMVALIAYSQIAKKDKPKDDKKDKTDILEKEDNNDDDDEVSEVINSINTVVKTVSNNVEKKETKYYSISFNTNGGTLLDDEILTEDEYSFIMNTTREGWNFAGWYLDESLTIPYSFGRKLTSDVTLYAKWTKNVVYMVDGNLLDIVNQVALNEEIPLLSASDVGLDSENFDVAWSYKRYDDFSNLETVIVNSGDLFTDNKSSTNLVLELTKLEKFIMNFYYAEGGDLITSKKVTESKVVDLSDVDSIVSQTVQGEFGWYYLDGAVKIDFAHGSAANKDIINLFVSDVYTVVYNELIEGEQNDFEEINSQKVSKDSKMNDILKPEDKEDKEFDGWYIIENEDITDDKLDENTIVNKDLNVVGKWKEKLIISNSNLSEEPVVNEKTEILENDVAFNDPIVEEEKPTEEIENNIVELPEQNEEINLENE